MGRYKKHPESLNPDIKRMYVKENKSLREIGKYFSMHQQSVKRRLQSMGIEIRNRSEAMKTLHKNKRSKNE